MLHEEDVDADGADQRQVARPLGTDVLLQQGHEETDDVLEDDLELAGVLDAQTRADEQADGRRDENDQNASSPGSRG